MERNTQLFNDIAEALLVHPDRYVWNQKIWGDGEPLKRNAHTCGSAHCTSGFACAFSGYMPFDPIEWSWGEVILPEHAELMVTNRNDYEGFWEPANQDLRERYTRIPNELGRELLGLDDAEAETLFAGDWEPFQAEWRSWRKNSMPTRFGFKRSADHGSTSAQAIALILLGRGAKVRSVGTIYGASDPAAAHVNSL